MKEIQTDGVSAGSFKLKILGNSMYPTIKPLDIAHVIPYGNNKILRGDIVIYRDQILDRKVAHRIISIGPGGYGTEGDNNLERDKILLTPREIIGKVVLVDRDGRPIRKHGGARGVLWHDLLRIKVILKKLVFRYVTPIYHFFSRSKIFKRFAPDIKNIRLVTFQKARDIEIQFWSGPFMIGRYHKKRKILSIEAPFKLFIDDELLLGAINDYSIDE